MIAKTKRKKKFCGSFQRALHNYGDLVTTDHVHMTDWFGNKGVDGYPRLLTLLDRYTNYRACLPVHSMDEAETTNSLRHMRGNDEWRLMYSDNWSAIKSACSNIGVNWEPCQPGVHQTNALIENTNQQIIYDIKAGLSAAGLPSCFWPYAAVYVCMLHNLTKANTDGDMPWVMKFGEEFPGKTIPIGCGVFFLPAPTKYKLLNISSAISVVGASPGLRTL